MSHFLVAIFITLIGGILFVYWQRDRQKLWKDRYYGQIQEWEYNHLQTDNNITYVVLFVILASLLFGLGWYYK